MNNKKKFLIIGLVIFVIAVIVGINIYQSSKEPKVIKIGAILPLTGEVALFGQWLKEGIDLASDEYGTKISIIYEDNKNQAAQSVGSFQKLVNAEKVLGIITARTPTAIALTPLISKSQIPVVYTFADLPEKLDGCIINYHFPTKDEVKILAETMQGLGNKAILLTINDEFGQLAANLFKENYKGKIIFEDIFDVKQTNFRSIIRKIPKDADFIFLVAYEQNFVNLIKQLKQYNITIPIVGPNVLTVFLPLVEEYLNTPIYVTMSLYDAEKVSNNILYTQFKEKFEKRYDKEPNMVNAEAYEGVKFLINAIINSNMNLKKICESFNSYHYFSSIFGNLKISPDGQIHFPLAVVKFENNQKEIIKIWYP